VIRVLNIFWVVNDMNEINEKQITLAEYIRILYRGRWIILISFATVFCFVAYYTYNTTPIYNATAKVMFKENAAARKALLSVTNFGEKETMINNQVQILTSRTLAEKVIKRLKASEYADKLVILGNSLQANKKTFGFKKTISKIFGGFLSGSKENEAITTPENDLTDGYVSVLMGSISVTPIRNTDIVELSVSATSPFEAAYLTNTLAEVYQEENQLENQAEVKKVKDFLEEQLQIIQENLKNSETALKEYKEQEKVVALPEETSQIVTKVAEFEALTREAELELESTKKRLSYVDEELDKSKQNFDTESIMANPFIDEIKKQMAELETEKSRYIASLVNKGLYDEQDPTIKAYNEKIKLLSEKFKARVTQLAANEIGDPVALIERKIELESNIQSLIPRINALRGIVKEYNELLEAVPSKSLTLARLERTAKLDEKITLMMKEKFEESRITEVGQLGNVRIIDPARPPLAPIKPKKKMNLMLGVILGLGLGISITFMLEYLDNSVRYVEDIERLNIPTLGTIPIIKIEETVRKSRRNGKVSGQIKLEDGNNNGHLLKSRLITHFAPKSPISEAYRSLRTSIQFSRAESPTILKTIMITSSGPQEGKSTTVANLAITMAQMGSKILLVDTDLRRPILHSIFGLSRSKGISNYLVGKIPIEEAILKTEIDNLYLMPAGTLPPNPSELLGSIRMQECLDGLKKSFDFILFDSPPVIAVTDAAVLGSKMDGVILVIKSGQTHKNAVERSYEILKNVCKRQILGALLNVVNVEGTYGSYYYYYYHYYYGKSDSAKKKHHVHI